jgi:demethylspheroidene O-methyltransferase
MSDQTDLPRGAMTVRTRWVLWRNRVLSSAPFQHWAARNILTRSTARRRAAAQFDLVAGFVYSQILAAFVEAGLLEYLHGHMRSDTDVAGFTRLPADAADRLLRAAAALDLTESPQPGYWTLGQAGAELAPNVGAQAMIRHHHLLYADLAAPLALLRAGRSAPSALSRFWTYVAPDDSAQETPGAEAYSALMAATQPMVVAEIIDRFDFQAHRRLLDIGGGSGMFARTIAAAVPGPDLGIFDLREVVADAAQKFAVDPPARAITLHPGSFKADALPTGYDLITLVRILHDHDDDVAISLLRSIFAALPAGGTLLMVEPMAAESAAPRMGDAYFGMYLWAMSSGRPRSAAALTQMLSDAGFRSVRRIATAQPIITGALVAVK